MKTMVSTAGGHVGPVVVPDGLLPGQKAGPWVVERELGRGGMGAVYAVVHDEIGKRAALKVVHSRLLTPSFNPDRMMLEAKVVNQVGHPNIVDIFETGKLPDGRPYIVMERLEGQALSDRADESKIDPDQVIGILLQVCDALMAAHACGVIHRDLKLDNVFLVDNPDDPYAPKVKLLDWGIAKVINHEVRHTVEGQLVGTPQYLAPEQARGASVSPATDVYSLGVMAYELFLEQLPFEAETSAEIMAMHLRAAPPPPSDLWPEIPPQLEDLLMQMLAKNPEHRPSGLEVARRLEAVRAELRRQREELTKLSMMTVLPVEAPQASRLVAEVTRAAEDRPIDPRPQKRWQVAVGTVALVASALLVLLSRDGDTQSANADSAPPRPTPVTAPVERQAIADELPLEMHAAVSDALPHAATLAEPAEPAAPAASAAPSAVVKPTTPSPRANTRATTSQRSSRKPAALPRRAAKVDLDGTLDPYR